MRGRMDGALERAGRRTAVVLLWVASLVPSTSALGDQQQQQTCFAKRATIIGTDGADVLTGTKRADVIVARGGDDRIVGKDGEDKICAGPGRDVVLAGGDTDRVAGGPGADALRGEDGWDTLKGNSGGDSLLGGPEADFLNPAGGDDVVRGGEGLDVVEYFDSPRRIHAHLGRARVKGWGDDHVHGVAQIEGSDYDDVIVGGKGSEAMDGLGGDDRLLGRGGRDYLAGEAGDDVLKGGPAGDYAMFFLSPQPVVADLPRGTATGEGNDRLSGIESLFGSLHADTLIGDSRENHFIGGNGGPDLIEGGGGPDLMYALFDSTFEGGAGTDEAFFLVGPAIVDLTTGLGTSAGSAFVMSEVETLRGTGGADQFIGDANANLLIGNRGDDTLSGADGDDTIQGSEGDDELDGGDGSDDLDGGEGTDRCLNGEQNHACEESLTAGRPDVGGRGHRGTRPPAQAHDICMPHLARFLEGHGVERVCRNLYGAWPDRGRPA